MSKAKKPQSKTPQGPKQPRTLQESLGLLEQAEELLVAQTERGLRRLIEADDDYNEQDWYVVYDSEKGGRTELIDPITLAEKRNKIRWMYWQGSEHIRRVVRNGINYVVGAGMICTPEGLDEGDKKLKKTLTDFWRNWGYVNSWVSKQQETVERGYLDGEIFWRWIEKGKQLCLRFLEPEDIQDPTPGTTWTLGIEYDPLDVEDVKAYAWNPKHAMDAPLEWLQPDVVQHIFWLGTKSMVRGIPPLIPIMNRTKQYEGWLNDRLILNKLRARIALIRKHMKASPSQVTAFANANKDGETLRSPKTPGVYDRRKMFPPGSIIDVTGKTEYEFLSPNVQASDVRHDGRNIILSIATGAGQSEVMVSADASNASFSSTWIAEAPPVKEFSLFQSIMSGAATEAWHRVMSWGQDTGAIPKSPDRDEALGLSGYDVLVQPPVLVSRDRKPDTEANSIMHAAGALSKKTWMIRDGIDPEVESENIRMEEAESVDLGHDPDVSNTTTLPGPPDELNASTGDPEDDDDSREE